MQTAGILCAHRGSHVITRSALADLETPPATESWKPIRHVDLVQALADQFQQRGVEIVREQLAVGNNGKRLFGVFDLSTAGPNGDYRAAFGFRHGNDRAMSLRAVAGGRVFVCDNLLLAGDEFVLSRKHTSGFDLNAEIAKAVDRFGERFARLTDQVTAMKSRTMSDDDARRIIYELFVQRRLLPLRLLPKVHREWFEPSHAEFATSPSVWRLNNAFTEAAKSLKPASRMAGLNGLGRYFANLLN